MSTLPYLQKLRKSDLTEFAETSKLQNYASLKKAELETALDEHLRANSTAYAKVPSLGEYYKRLDAKVKSPVKKIAEKVSDVIKSDDEAPAQAKKVRRKTKSAADEITEAAENLAAATDNAVSALVKTPGKEVARRSSAFVSAINPPSPAVVADAIEHQTRRIRTSISHVYERSQIEESLDYARSLLSTNITVTFFSLLVEAYGLRAEILPNKLLTELPPVPYVKQTRTAVHVPDLFQLLNVSFWGPFTVWILTTILLPAAVAFFINLPLKQLPQHNYATRRASIKHDPHKQFDPFTFSVARGLITYLVLSTRFNFAGLFSHHTVSVLNEAIPGGYITVVTSSSIAAAVSLYEAVLKKH